MGANVPNHSSFQQCFEKLNLCHNQNCSANYQEWKEFWPLMKYQNQQNLDISMYLKKLFCSLLKKYLMAPSIICYWLLVFCGKQHSNSTQICPRLVFRSVSSILVIVLSFPILVNNSVFNV